MYELCLTGKIELKSPDDFIQDFSNLLKKHKVTFHGQSSLTKLPDYVDYQRVEKDSTGSVQVQDSDI